MLPVNIFCFALLLIHNANSQSNVGPTLPYREGRLPPPPVLPSVSGQSQFSETNVQTAKDSNLATASLVPSSNRALPISATNSSERSIEKVIIVYPSNHKFPSLATTARPPPPPPLSWHQTVPQTIIIIQPDSVLQQQQTLAPVTQQQLQISTLTPQQQASVPISQQEQTQISTLAPQQQTSAPISQQQQTSTLISLQQTTAPISQQEQIQTSTLAPQQQTSASISQQQQTSTLISLQQSTAPNSQQQQLQTSTFAPQQQTPVVLPLEQPETSTIVSSHQQSQVSTFTPQIQLPQQSIPISQQPQAAPLPESQLGSAPTFIPIVSQTMRPTRATIGIYSTPFPSTPATNNGNFSPVLNPITIAPQPTSTHSQSTIIITPSTTTTPLPLPTITTPQWTFTTTQSTTTTPQPTTTTPQPTTTTPQLITIKPLLPTTTKQPETWTMVTTKQPTTWTSVTTSRPVLTLVDYACISSNHYSAIANKCDSYIECKNNIAQMKLCPNGLIFKNTTVWPDYPCVYAYEGTCPMGDATLPSLSTFECTTRYGHYPMKNGDCSKYIVCQEGVATIMNCPDGLVFNEKLKGCDWPVNVPNCNLNVFRGFKCPEQSDGVPADSIFKYKYQNSCNQFIACQAGSPRLLTCDRGLYFDEKSQVCVESTRVTNCSV